MEGQKGGCLHRGYVKLWRKTLESGIFNDIGKTFKVACACLMLANHKKRNVYGVDLNPGEFITGRKKLAKAAKASEQEVRTALTRLQEKHRFLTIKTTNKFSIISIINWPLYQSEDERDNHTPQPTANQQLTTNKNDKNVKNTNVGIGNNKIVAPCNIVLDKFRSHYYKKFAIEYKPNYGKDKRLINDLLKTTSIEEIEKLMIVFFNSNDEFIKKTDYGVGIFTSQINKINLQSRPARGALRGNI